MTEIFPLLIFAMSLCADCFAVTACSSVTLRRIDWKSVAGISLIFGLVQAGLLFFGWAFGGIFVGYVKSFSKWIAFILLLYVGGSMLQEAIRGSSECRNLNGLKNVILGAIATSMDAFTVGVSLSMQAGSSSQIMPQTIAVFLVTILSVVLGIAGGSKLGSKFGHPAEGIGGAVLILIGLGILFEIL